MKELKEANQTRVRDCNNDKCMYHAGKTYLGDNSCMLREIRITDGKCNWYKKFQDSKYIEDNFLVR